MTDEELIEAVAKAVYLAQTPAGADWNAVHLYYQETVWRPIARAVIPVAQAPLLARIADLERLVVRAQDMLPDCYKHWHLAALRATEPAQGGDADRDAWEKYGIM